MKIALYIDTSNPEDLKKARKALDALEDVPTGFDAVAEYEAWLARLKAEEEVEG